VGDERTASSRYRCYAPSEYLRKSGVPSEIYREEHQERYAAVVFQKRYGAADLALAEALKRRGVRVALDMCDNHLYVPWRRRSKFRSRARDLRRMIECVDVLSVSTPTLASYLRHSASRVIDDLVELGPARDPRPLHADRVEFVWFGNAGARTARFGLVDLALVRGSLERIARNRALHLKVVSNHAKRASKVLASARFEWSYEAWSEEGCRDAIAAADICLLPAYLSPITRPKTNNRALLSLWMGTPVIASAIPSYRVFPSGIRFERWEAHVREILSAPAEIATEIREAQDFIRKRWSAEVIAPQWRNFADDLLGRRR
jgi:glycosyltransferase involved in cell wall biosynthesis